MISTFKSDERSHAAWLDGNPRGHVFNHFGGNDPGDHVVHRPSCSFLRREVDAGGRTTVEKMCGAREEVEREASRLRAGPQGWKHCGVCLR